VYYAFYFIFSQFSLCGPLVRLNISHVAEWKDWFNYWSQVLDEFTSADIVVSRTAICYAFPSAFLFTSCKELLYISHNFLFEQSHSSYCVTRGNSPVQSLPLSGFRKHVYRYFVGLLVWGIGPSQGLTRGNIKTHIRAPNGTRLGLRGHWHELHEVLEFLCMHSMCPTLTLTLFQNGFNVATIHLKTQRMRLRKSCAIRLKMAEPTFSVISWLSVRMIATEAVP
jgi:hypothetical protein